MLLYKSVCVLAERHCSFWKLAVRGAQWLAGSDLVMGGVNGEGLAGCCFPLTDRPALPLVDPMHARDRDIKLDRSRMHGMISGLQHVREAEGR